jgi:hypothetical protein
MLPPSKEGHGFQYRRIDLFPIYPGRNPCTLHLEPCTLATGQFPKTRENVVCVRMQNGPKPPHWPESQVLSPLLKGERQGPTGGRSSFRERGME